MRHNGSVTFLDSVAHLLPDHYGAGMAGCIIVTDPAQPIGPVLGAAARPVSFRLDR